MKSVDEMVESLEGTGWMGFAVWSVGKDSWNAALLHSGDSEPDYRTVLWEYANTPSEAIRQITDKAQEVHPKEAATDVQS